MNKYLLFGLLLIILIVGGNQQAPASPAAPAAPSSQANDPFQQFNTAIKRNLEETNMVDTMEEKLRKQIIIWSSIGLSFVLYFSVMAIIDMSNPKSSILYAKYDTTRGGNEY